MKPRKKKIKLRHRSHIPPPSIVHKDKRKKPRAKQKQEMFKESFFLE